MNQDFEDNFSMQGAYRDNDGIAPGDNLWGAPDSGFTSSEVGSHSSPKRLVVLQDPAFDSGRFFKLCAVGFGIGVIVVVLIFSLR